MDRLYREAPRPLVVHHLMGAPSPSISSEAVAFYERYGFTALDVAQGQLGDRPEPVPLYLEIGAIPATG